MDRTVRLNRLEFRIKMRTVEAQKMWIFLSGPHVNDVFHIWRVNRKNDLSHVFEKIAIFLTAGNKYQQNL